MAVLYALKEFLCYLHGRHFTLQTDNSAVAQIKTSRDLRPKFARWLDQLEEFQCTIEHRPGLSMKDVDALSCRQDDAEHSPFYPDAALFVLADWSSSARDHVQAMLRDVRQSGVSGVVCCSRMHDGLLVF